jgi:hypothetical protein
MFLQQTSQISINGFYHFHVNFGDTYFFKKKIIWSTLRVVVFSSGRLYPDVEEFLVDQHFYHSALWQVHLEKPNTTSLLTELRKRLYNANAL